MDWFERLTGFPETTYDETRSRLDVSGATLTSRVNGRSYGVGELTLYRNYFAPVDGVPGQTEARQIDALADLARAFGEALDRDPAQLWSMTNGYALASEAQLAAIGGWLEAETDDALDRLRGRLRIGLHANVEVTDIADDARPGPKVTQAFCSALPVAYSGVDSRTWQPFARLVLSAAYEATLWAGVLHAQAGGARTVLLTRLGGGAFGNEDVWIDWAIRRAITLAAAHDLDVRLVNYGAPLWTMEALEAEWADA